MRIFRSFKEADQEVERELKKNGVKYQSETWQNKKVAGEKEFMTKELLGYSFLVKDPNIDEYIGFRKLNREWLAQEYLERVNTEGSNPGDAWRERDDVWRQFMRDGRFDYTYGERIGGQVLDVIKLLEKVPSSRHGLISVYEPMLDNGPDSRHGERRVPCTMYYMVMIRDKKLVMFYNIRSNDYREHFPYDIVLARKLQETIAGVLVVPVGDFVYQSISLHVFYRQGEVIF